MDRVKLFEELVNRGIGEAFEKYLRKAHPELAAANRKYSQN